MSGTPFVNVKLGPSALLPRRMRSGDVGFDLTCNETTTLTGLVTPIPTGVIIAGPIEHSLPEPLMIFLRIDTRSGVAAKQNMFAVGGIIDPNYRGELKVLLCDPGYDYNNPRVIEAGTRIAQLVPTVSIEPFEFMEVDDVVMTERGTQGFGSSGR